MNKEQRIKKLLSLRNYRTNEFTIRIDSDNSCHITLMKPNEDYDIATLQKIQEHLKSEIKEVVKLESYFTYPGYYKLYQISVLTLKLK